MKSKTLAKPAGISAVVLVSLSLVLVRTSECVERTNEAQRLQREYEEALTLQEEAEAEGHFKAKSGDFPARVYFVVQGSQELRAQGIKMPKLSWVVNKSRTRSQTAGRLGVRVEVRNSATLVLRFFSSEPRDPLNDPGAIEHSLGQLVGSEQVPYTSDLIDVSDILGPDGELVFPFCAVIMQLDEQRQEKSGGTSDSSSEDPLLTGRVSSTRPVSTFVVRVFQMLLAWRASFPRHLPSVRVDCPARFSLKHA